MRPPTLAPVLLALAIPVVAAEVAPETPAPDLSRLEPAVAEQLARLGELAGERIDEAALEPSARAEAWGELGMAYHAYDLLAEAATCYEQAERLAPEDAAWPYYRAVVAESAGEIETALGQLRPVLELEPDNLAALVRASDAARELGRYDEALAFLDQATEAGNDPVLEARAGELALAQGDYRTAVERLSSALEAVPAATRLHHPLGLAYRALGDLEAARRHLALRGAVGLAPPDPRIDALAGLRVGERVALLEGRRAFAAGSFEEAADLFLEAVVADPASVRARVNLGAALSAVGDPRGAAAQLEEALRLEPDNLTARFNLASLLMGQGEAEEASGHFERFLEERPDDEEAWLAWVDTRLALGDYDGALERLEEASALVPQSVRVTAAHARFLALVPSLDHRDGSRAVELAGRAFTALPTVEHGVLVSDALREADRCADAAAWLDDLLDRAGGSAEEASLAALRDRRAAIRTDEPCRP